MRKTLYLISVTLVISAFLLGFKIGKSKIQKSKPVQEDKKSLSKEDEIVQQRVIKEIQNFLNYNGEQQEDIL